MKRFALILLLLGCSAEGVEMGATQPTRAPAMQPDAGTSWPEVQPSSTTWTNSLTFGTGYHGDAGVGPTDDGAGNTLTGAGATFSVTSLYYLLTTVDDIAGRSVVIYTGASPSIAGAVINGGAAGPATGHVVLGHMMASAIGTDLYHACLTSVDRSKPGWNVGMVCTDVAAALITITN